jgi:hypothetical protein
MPLLGRLYAGIERVSTSLDMSSFADQRRNFILGVLNGAIFKVTMLLIDSQTVLAWFLIQLGVPTCTSA